MESTNETDPLVGRLIAGRYEVVAKLNQGGVGIVYLAMQRPLDRPVALKLLLKKHADDETAIKRFEIEAAAVARLADAHIVTLYDFGSTESGDLYIAMEFLQGQSLRDLLDVTGFVPWERALHIVRGVCCALVAAHSHNIVHRDLKPANIMLVETNGDVDFAKVLDFGLARSILSQQPGITRADVIPGTPVYMSPERANGISNDPRSDLYALGAVWFELLTGEPPFSGENSIKVIMRHIHEAPRRPSAVRPEQPIPDVIDALILALLEKSVEKRPPSARALLDRVDLIARPPGWHVGRTHELGRRGHGDLELHGFAAAAGDLGDGMRFLIEEGEPLTLEKQSPPPAVITQDHPVSGSPLLLTRKKPSSPGIPQDSVPPAPAPLVVSAGPVLRIESLAEVAGCISMAKTTATVAELCCAFLVTRFDRALVLDLQGCQPLALASSTSSGEILPMAAVVAVWPECGAVTALSRRREPYAGPALLESDWLRWFEALGGWAPGAMFGAGHQRDGEPTFFFYADHRTAPPPTTTKDTLVLLREAAAALSMMR